MTVSWMMVAKIMVREIIDFWTLGLLTMINSLIENLINSIAHILQINFSHYS